MSENTADITPMTDENTDAIKSKPRYRHKIWYWVTAAMWFAIAFGWVKIAVDMQRVHWPWLSWFFVLCYIGFAVREIYAYFKDREKK